MLKLLMEMGIREKVFSGVSIKPYSQASTVGMCLGGVPAQYSCPFLCGQSLFPLFTSPSNMSIPTSHFDAPAPEDGSFCYLGKIGKQVWPSFLDDLHCLPLVVVQFYQCLQIKRFHSVREIREMGLGGFGPWLFSSCQHHGKTFWILCLSVVVFLEEKPAREWEPDMAESLENFEFPGQVPRNSSQFFV